MNRIGCPICENGNRIDDTQRGWEFLALHIMWAHTSVIEDYSMSGDAQKYRCCCGWNAENLPVLAAHLKHVGTDALKEHFMLGIQGSLRW